MVMMDIFLCLRMDMCVDMGMGKVTVVVFRWRGGECEVCIWSEEGSFVGWSSWSLALSGPWDRGVIPVVRVV